MLTQFDKINLKKIRNDLDALLTKYGKEQGIAFSLGKISYMDTAFHVKLEAAVVSEGQGATNARGIRMEEDFKKYANLYGLKPEHLGQKFEFLGEHYTIVGMNMPAKKYPLIVKMASDGKNYKFRVEDFKRRMGIK